MLRKTVGRKLPEALLAAGKRGFDMPLRTWFRDGDFADSIVKRSVAMTGLSGPVVGQILAEQRAGQRDYGTLLWMLMVLGAVKGTAETPAALGLEHVTDPAPAEAG